ncbi:MAG: hypothetical protein V7K90_15115 [Nostoc sp.]|uniref:hypothetical protein n=2 Tax=unclassified Nostoc TaxID=2593658 RepID=UPI002FFCA4D8
MGRKYIIFRAEMTEEHDAQKRSLTHTGALTDILAEHFDSSSRALPTPGYRLREYHKIEQFADSRFPGASTHSRVGDWEVTRVEEYSSELPISDFEAIVICYCHYSPVTTSLEPLPEIQGTQKLQEVQ